jgi:hypothetical protein
MMGNTAKTLAGGAVTSVVIEEEENAREVADYPNRYVPIPPNGRRCEWTGLGHAKLYHILSVTGMARRKVRVANLRAPGTKRGQTLFHVGDMLQFLDTLSREQARTVEVGE